MFEPAHGGQQRSLPQGTNEGAKRVTGDRGGKQGRTKVRPAALRPVGCASATNPLSVGGAGRGRVLLKDSNRRALGKRAHQGPPAYKVTTA